MEGRKVPLLDLQAQFRQTQDEILPAMKYWSSRRRSPPLGYDFAVGCASGSDALRLALMAHDIGPAVRSRYCAVYV
jgi:hypothetical protein